MNDFAEDAIIEKVSSQIRSSSPVAPIERSMPPLAVAPKPMAAPHGAPNMPLANAVQPQLIIPNKVQKRPSLAEIIALQTVEGFW